MAAEKKTKSIDKIGFCPFSNPLGDTNASKKKSRNTVGFRMLVPLTVLGSIKSFNHSSKHIASVCGLPF